jgi:hypothetical protein
MAELTHLDEKLAGVLGLAQAAQVATKRVAALAGDEDETQLIDLMECMGARPLSSKLTQMMWPARATV